MVPTCRGGRCRPPQFCIRNDMPIYGTGIAVTTSVSMPASSEGTTFGAIFPMEKSKVCLELAYKAKP